MKWIFNLLLATAALLAANVATAEERSVPGSTLRQMGLAGIEQLSDAEGLQVRGKGTFASVWGGSTAKWGGQSSSNNYSAGSSWLGKSAGAQGSSFSFAGKFQLGGRFGR